MAHWISLTTASQLDLAIKASKKHPVLIYKHSTRCHNCADIMAMMNLRLEELAAHAPLIYLDLLAHREVSNLIAEKFSILHQSPQVVVLHKGKAAFYLNHWDITVDALISKMEAIA